MKKARQKITEITKVFLIGQGSVAILFGLAAMCWPGITALALAYLFAAFLLVDGLALSILSLGHHRHGGVRRLWGIVQLLIGVFVLLNPAVSFAALILVLGFTILVRGVFSLAHAVLHNDAPPDERLLHGLLGGLGVVVGAIVVAQPASGGLAFVWVLGLYAVVTGSLLIGLAFGAGRLRRRRNHTTIEF